VVSVSCESVKIALADWYSLENIECLELKPGGEGLIQFIVVYEVVELQEFLRIKFPAEF